MFNFSIRLIFIFQFILVLQAHSKSKTARSINTVPAKMEAASAASEALRISLYLLNPDNSIAIADGVYAQYNNTFSNDVDIKDAIKLTNISENFAIERNGILLTLERRRVINISDTLFFNLTQTNRRNYQFEFIPDRLNHAGLVAFLQDSYLKISIPLDLNDTTSVNFYVNGDPASSLPNRFRVVFAQSHQEALPWTPAPVHFLQKNRNVHVAMESKAVQSKLFNWERPAGGQHLASEIPVQYNYPDESDNGVNKKLTAGSMNNEEKIYNNNSNVFTGNKLPAFSVYPNPVMNGTVILHFNNQPEGSYYVSLLNSSGQLLFCRHIKHSGGSNTQDFPVNWITTPGNYLLQVTTAGKPNIGINVYIK